MEERIRTGSEPGRPGQNREENADVKTIYEKELQQYFHSVIGYVFLAIFILISSYYFLVTNLLTRNGDISDCWKKVFTTLE